MNSEETRPELGRRRLGPVSFYLYHINVIVALSKGTFLFLANTTNNRIWIFTFNMAQLIMWRGHHRIPPYFSSIRHKSWSPKGLLPIHLNDLMYIGYGSLKLISMSNQLNKVFSKVLHANSRFLRWMNDKHIRIWRFPPSPSTTFSHQINSKSIYINPKRVSLPSEIFIYESHTVESSSQPTAPPMVTQLPFQSYELFEHRSLVVCWADGLGMVRRIYYIVWKRLNNKSTYVMKFSMFNISKQPAIDNTFKWVGMARIHHSKVKASIVDYIHLTTH